MNHYEVLALRTRLVRTTQLARDELDYPAFQDLSSNLRIWTEYSVADLVPVHTQLGTRNWPCVGLSKRFLEALRAIDAVVCMLPEKVTLRFDGDHELAGGPLRPGSGESSVIVRYSGLPDGSRSVYSFAFMRSGQPRGQDWDVASRPGAFAQRREANFDGWLDSPLLWIGGQYCEGRLQARSVPRRDLIKRLANAFGGSHIPKEAPTKEMEQLINALQSHTILGVPVPYFILLSVADQILTATECLTPPT